MTKTLRLLAASLTLLLGVAFIAPRAEATPERPDHTTTEVINVCRLLELSLVGPDPNLLGRSKERSIHLWGMHIAQCCFYDLRGGPAFVGQYTWGWDDVAYFYDPWC